MFLIMTTLLFAKRGTFLYFLVTCTFEVFFAQKKLQLFPCQCASFLGTIDALQSLLFLKVAFLTRGNTLTEAIFSENQIFLRIPIVSSKRVFVEICIGGQLFMDKRFIDAVRFVGTCRCNVLSTTHFFTKLLKASELNQTMPPSPL